MLKNYLRIALRHLLKHKTFSFINIIGLAIGVSSCLIIYLYVHSELNFDQDARARDRTVRLTSGIVSPESITKLATTPAILATTLQREVPGVETTVRIAGMNPAVKLHGEIFKETNFVKADPSVFDVFHFRFLEGTKKGVLDKPNSIVLSGSLAKKYFGSAPALGKTILIDGQNWLVTGVVADRPANSDIAMRAIMSGDFEKDKTWIGQIDCYTFAVFQQTPDLAAIDRKLSAFGKKYGKPELVAAAAPDYDLTFRSELLTDVHFSKGKDSDTPKGSRQTIYIFSVLAVFILLIALLNYINLSTAKATDRAKEVGIRKVSGAGRWQLIRQFLFESFLVMTISCLVALGLMAVMLPYVNMLLVTPIEANRLQIFGAAGIIFVLSWLLAGIYPAFVLTSFKPVLVLKGNFRRSNSGIALIKAVTITQFAIAAALILGTTVIYSQMTFIRNKDLGYNKDQILVITMPTDSVYAGARRAFRNELRGRPEVHGMTVGSPMTIEGLQIGTTAVENEGKKRQLLVRYYNIDTNYIPLLGIRLLEGRNFSASFGTDTAGDCIVNEAFVKTAGWKNGVGQFIDPGAGKIRIIGVVKNFNYKSVHNPVEPLVLVNNDNPFFNSTTVKTTPASLPVIRAVYNKYFPALPIECGFLDEMVQEQYVSDRTTMILFRDFTVLAIFLSCLGLYGLVALIAVQRTKEIGIRKVLGASIAQLFTLMTRDFVVLVFWGLVVALPVSGLLMSRWLGSYAYHIGIGWWMFLVPVLFLVLIAVMTVSKEVVKAALVKPAKVLRAD